MMERNAGPSWLLPRVKRIGVVHAQGESVRLVVAEAGPARIVACESIPTASPADLRAALTRHHVRHIIRIAPASRTIARAVQIPRGPAPELLSALELMAEAQLAAVPDAHRRGWGLTPSHSGPGNASALLVGWLGAPVDPIIDGPHPEAHESWTSELVGLVLLVGAENASSAAFVDRAAGSIGVVSADPAVRIRSVREDPESSARLDEAIGEIRASMGDGAVVAADGSATVVMTRAVRDRLGARAPDAMQPQWVARYAVATAVALAAVDEEQFPRVRPLLSMRSHTPAVVTTPMERALRWIASPRHAAAVVAMALAAMLLVPLGLAWVRYAVLSARLESTREGGADTQELQARGDFMDELSRRRWPMTKLLADLAGSMPVGVQVESITLSPGDRVAIRGTAETSELVSEFQNKLNATGVFDTGPGSRERVAEGFTFDISSGRVVRPTAEAKGVEDYAARSLGVRLYGEGYKEVEAVEQARQREVESRRAGRGTPLTAGFDAGSSRQAEEEPIPSALTPEKIATLDRAEAGKEMSARRKVASRAGIDAEVKRRLLAEVDALRARLTELKGQGK